MHYFVELRVSGEIMVQRSTDWPVSIAENNASKTQVEPSSSANRTVLTQRMASARARALRR